MKYKVSLLPEENRKRLTNKKKLEKIQAYSLVVLIVLAVFLGVVMLTSVYANSQLKKVKMLDNECAQEVAELQQFREINANLQEKVQLIQNIQVEEPQLVNFIAKVSNLKHPGISINSVECTDWKTLRNCILTGSCDNRSEYLSFEEALRGIDGVSSVSCVAYTQGLGDSAIVEFTVSITCSGGSAAAVSETVEDTAQTSETTAEATE